MEQILNLTQHEATESQKKAGVIEPLRKEEVKSLLTFTTLPSVEELKHRARQLIETAFVELGTGVPFSVMIGGAPYFMSYLEREFSKYDIKTLYAYSERKVSEKTIEGKVVKVFTFEHLGFVEGGVL